MHFCKASKTPFVGALLCNGRWPPLWFSSILTWLRRCRLASSPVCLLLRPYSASQAWDAIRDGVSSADFGRLRFIALLCKVLTTVTNKWLGFSVRARGVLRATYPITRDWSCSSVRIGLAAPFYIGHLMQCDLRHSYCYVVSVSVASVVSATY